MKIENWEDVKEDREKEETVEPLIYSYIKTSRECSNDDSPRGYFKN